MSKTRITENGIHYQRVGDHDLPMLTLPTPSESIGRWGRIRRAYLKKHRPVRFMNLLLNGTLDAELVACNRQAEERYQTAMTQLQELENVNEQLKSENQMEWVRRMNDIDSRAREVAMEILFD